MKSTPVKLNDMPGGAMASIGNQYPLKMPIKPEVKPETSAESKATPMSTSSVTPVVTSAAPELPSTPVNTGAEISEGVVIPTGPLPSPKPEVSSDGTTLEERIKATIDAVAARAAAEVEAEEREEAERLRHQQAAGSHLPGSGTLSGTAGSLSDISLSTPGAASTGE